MYGQSKTINNYSDTNHYINIIDKPRINTLRFWHIGYRLLIGNVLNESLYFIHRLYNTLYYIKYLYNTIISLYLYLIIYYILYLLYYYLSTIYYIISIIIYIIIITYYYIISQSICIIFYIIHNI